MWLDQFDYFDAYLSNRNQKELKNFIDDFLRKNHSPVFVASEEIEQYIYSWLIKQYPLIENLFSFLEPESQQTVVSAINILINYLRSKEEPLENSDSQFNKLLFLIFHSRRATITDCNLLLEKIKDEALKALVLQKRKEALKEIMDTLTKPYQDGDEVHQKKFKSYLFQIINLLKVKFSKDGIKKDKIASIFEMLLKHQNQEESLVEINRYIENFIKLNIAPSKPIESIACLLEIKAIWQRESENRKKAIGANEKQSSPLSDETDPFWKKDGFKDFFDELLAAIKRKELKGLIDSFKTNEKSPDLPSPRLP